MGNSGGKTCVENAARLDLGGTLAQAIFRSLLGVMSGSMGMAAQGLYSIGDAITKSLTLASIRISKIPPSKTFPFGAGKILFVTSLIIGISLIGTGVFLASTSFNEPNTVEATGSLFAIVGVIVSAAFSELMSRYLSCVATENDNIALRSASRDNRIDAITSIVVLTGIVLSDAGLDAADHIAALLVSLIVMNIGRIIAWDAIKGLLDVTVPRETLDEIARKSRTTKGVREIKLIRGRSLGEFWEVYMHVSIDEKLTIAESNAIINNLRINILDSFSEVQHAWIITVPDTSRNDDVQDYWADHLFADAIKQEPASPSLHSE
ncbi:CDF transporter MamV [Paramagnetospirillum kuznetsovii]|nr:CDF transporter MamV [Paramagnetospirillum kuznetsovii]